MIGATRRWLKRNRANIGIGVGLLGAGYLAGQYVLGKIVETRERMTSDRIARENLRRRFKQNQEDCTFTVLALLPTAAENILEALPVENITHELQQQRAAKLGRSTATSEIAPSEISSASPPRNDQGEDTTSASGSQSGSYMHTSQMDISTSSDSKATGRKSKAQLWNELKISSITRSFTLVYTLAFLTLLTRIQLNLLGRRSYLSSVVSLAAPLGKESVISLENNDDDKLGNNWGTDFDTNRKYLTFSWWLLHRGWKEIMGKVELAVQKAFGPVNPREDVTFERLSQLVIEVRKQVEGETEEARRNHKWLEYLLPPPDQEDFVLQESGILVEHPSSSNDSPALEIGTGPSDANQSLPTLFSQMQMPSASSDPLRRLLDETSDLVDSPTATHILTLLLDTLFSQLTDVAVKQQAFKIPDPSLEPSSQVQEILEGADGGTNNIADPWQASAKLATILAVITRQAHMIGNGVPNVYVQAMEDVRELEAFAAVVYSSHFDLESILRGDGDGEHTISDKVASRAAAAASSAKAEIEEKNRTVAGTTWGIFENVWGRVAGK